MVLRTIPEWQSEHNATILRRCDRIIARLQSGGVMISSIRNWLAMLLLLAAGIGMALPAHAQGALPADQENRDAATEAAG